jgi:hypothetical protein
MPANAHGSHSQRTKLVTWPPTSRQAAAIELTAQQPQNAQAKLVPQTWRLCKPCTYVLGVHAMHKESLR